MKEYIILTKKLSAELTAEILSKQRGLKQRALSNVLSHYMRSIINPIEEPIYKIVSNTKCRVCGGVILKDAGVYPKITCGGNPIIGCPVCKTFSSAKMLIERKDIIIE